MRRSAGLTRRRLLSGALAGSLLGPRWAVAAEGTDAAAPLVTTPAQALARLLEGNGRYATGRTSPRDFSVDRLKLVSGQQPFAAVLACSDSRVIPEFAFDLGRGELFVVRVAGNIADDDGLASLEYAVEYLGVRLILVVGHTSCGAVKSAIADIAGHVQLPGRLPLLIDALKPAVRLARDLPGDPLANAVRTNVRLQVEALRLAQPVLYPRIRSGRLSVAGGVYDLATGRVEIVTHD